jgi:hypothetical protein
MYKLILSETQLRVIKAATDLYSRVQSGQINEALELLPLDRKNFNYEDWHDFRLNVRKGLAPFTIQNVDGHSSNLGIHNKLTPEAARISYDIHQVVRYQLKKDSTPPLELPPRGTVDCYPAMKTSTEQNLPTISPLLPEKKKV